MGFGCCKQKTKRVPTVVERQRTNLDVTISAIDRENTPDIEELSSKCKEIEKKLLREECPDYMSADRAFQKVFGEEGPTDEHLADGVIQRVYDEIEKGMKIFEKMVRWFSSVCDDAPGEDDNPNEVATPWQTCFERNELGRECKCFIRQVTENVKDENGNDVRCEYAHINFHAVIKASFDEIVSQAQEVDLWPFWANFVKHGIAAGGDGLFRWWMQITYCVGTGFVELIKCRIQSRCTRFIDRERGFFSIIAEPNTDKAEALEIESDSPILPLSSRTFMAPSVDHNGDPVCFVCQYNIIPVPSWAPMWLVNKVLWLVAPALSKGFLRGTENATASEPHMERRREDASGTYKLCKEIESTGRAYQTEKYGPRFRITPRQFPVELLARQCSTKDRDPPSPLRSAGTRGQLRVDPDDERRFSIEEKDAKEIFIAVEKECSKIRDDDDDAPVRFFSEC